MGAVRNSDKSTKKIQRVQALIMGRVQGVFYRAWTQEQAKILGLGGWVRNRPDGTVELVAVGPKSKLQELLARCEQGPPAAKVNKVESQWEEDPKSCKNQKEAQLQAQWQNFTIRY